MNHSGVCRTTQATPGLLKRLLSSILKKGPEFLVDDDDKDVGQNVGQDVLNVSIYL